MEERSVEIYNLTKTYKIGKHVKPAVENLTFSIKKGEILGLIGPNGAGKTTTIKLILGILRADHGNIRVFGVDHKNSEVKKLIGYMPENPVYPSYLNGKEFLEYMGLLYKIDSNCLKNRIQALSEITGITEYLKKRISTFSKGMIQRLSLAQALINDPELLILDEPTNGLDPLGIINFRDIVQSIKKNKKTVLISSHNLTELEKVCDTVVLLKGGKIKKITKISSSCSEGEIEISLLGIEKEMIEKLGKSNYKFRVEDTKIFFDSIKDYEISLIIKLIGDSGGKIISVSKKQESLEDLFIRYVKEEE